MHMVNRFYKTLIYNAFSGMCVLCGNASFRQIDLCRDCEADLPWLESHCARCALPLASHEKYSECGRCISKPPAFSQCLSALRYDFPVDRLIAGFKHRGKLSYGSVLAQLWLNTVGGDIDTVPDLLVPVPIHWRRRWQRGFNQATVLANHWSKALDIPICHALTHPPAPPPQQALNAAMRQKNIKQAFAFIPQSPIRGKHVAVIDDVVTTTATANTVAAILARNGARQIDIWCLARTP
jgi:ComF family protein